MQCWGLHPLDPPWNFAFTYLNISRYNLHLRRENNILQYWIQRSQPSDWNLIFLTKFVLTRGWAGLPSCSAWWSSSRTADPENQSQSSSSCRSSPASRGWCSLAESWCIYLCPVCRKNGSIYYYFHKSLKALSSFGGLDTWSLLSWKGMGPPLPRPKILFAEKILHFIVKFIFVCKILIKDNYFHSKQSEKFANFMKQWVSERSSNPDILTKWYSC